MNKFKSMIGTLAIIGGILGLASCDSLFVDSVPSKAVKSTAKSTGENVETSIPKPTDVVNPSEVLPALPNNVEDSLIIHYLRSDACYTNWNFWIWSLEESKEKVTLDGAGYQFEYQDDNGVITVLSKDKTEIAKLTGLGVIVRYSTPDNDWARKDVENDIKVTFDNLEADANGNYHVYLISGDPIPKYEPTQKA